MRFILVCFNLLIPFFLFSQSNYVEITFTHPSSFNYNALNNIGYPDYKTNSPVYYNTFINKIDSNHTIIKIDIKQPTELFVMGNFLFVEPSQKYDFRIVKNSSRKDSIVVSGRFYGNKIMSDLLQSFKIINFDDYKNNEEQLFQELLELKDSKINTLDSLDNLHVNSYYAYKFYKNEIDFGYLNTLKSAWKTNFPSSEKAEKFVVSQYKYNLFENEENMTSKFYGFSLVDFITHIIVKRYGYDLTSENLSKSIDSTKKYFNGEQREFALSYIFGLYCKKQNINQKEIILKSYNDLSESLTIDKYKSSISYWYNYYLKANANLNDKLLNIKLKKSNSEFITLGELIGKIETPYFIDYWASWCSPCIAQIQNYNHVKKNFDSRNKIIFISLDDIKNEKKYLQSTKMLSIDSYIVTNSKDKELLEEYFQIPPIPRTIQMNNIKLINFNYDLRRLLNSL
jgi:thiol-disulfide isomerase/thioredoxin